jgi:hypothetical protein
MGDYWRKTLARGSQEIDSLLQTRQQNWECEMNRFLWQQHSKRLPPFSPEEPAEQSLASGPEIQSQSYVGDLWLLRKSSCGKSSVAPGHGEEKMSVFRNLRYKRLRTSLELTSYSSWLISFLALIISRTDPCSRTLCHSLPGPSRVSALYRAAVNIALTLRNIRGSGVAATD